MGVNNDTPDAVLHRERATYKEQNILCCDRLLSRGVGGGEDLGGMVH